MVVHGGGAAPTRRLHVSPVTSAGIAVRGYRVTSRASGASCEPGSEAIGQAYRCFAGNAVYDPCWPAKTASPTVLCVADPWLRTAAELKVSSALGAIPATGPSAGEPWGVQLASGQRCVLAQGAHNEFSGQVVDYYCTTRPGPAARPQSQAGHLDGAQRADQGGQAPRRPRRADPARLVRQPGQVSLGSAIKRGRQAGPRRS